MLGGAGAVLALNDRDSRETREKAAQDRQIAALRARLKVIQAPHRGAATDLKPPAGASKAEQLKAREALVTAVEARITADARRATRRASSTAPSPPPSAARS